MARIVWSERSLADLEAILSYLERVSTPLAKRYARSLVKRVEQLEAFPMSGGRVAEDDAEIYRQLIHGAYRIIYRCDGDAVYIVTVHHSARLLDPLGLG